MKEERKDIIKRLDEALVKTNESYMILDRDHLDVVGTLKEIIREAGEIKYQEGLLRAYVNMGAHYTLKEDHEEALAYMKKAKALVDYRLVPEKYYSEVSALYMMYYADLIGDLETAAEYYHLGVKAASKANDMVNVMVLKGNYGSLLVDTGHFEDALKLLHEVREYAELHYDKLVRYVYENMGRAYLALNLYEDAKAWYEKALNAAVKNGDTIIQNGSIRGLARIYMEYGQTEKAIETIKHTILVDGKGERIFDKLHAAVELSEIYIDLGLFEDGYNELLPYMEYAKTTIESLGYRYFQNLASIAGCIGYFEEAYRFEKLAHTMHIHASENKAYDKSRTIIVNEYREHINRLKALAKMGSEIVETLDLSKIVHILNDGLKDIITFDALAIGEIVDGRLHYKHYMMEDKTGDLIDIPIVKNKSLVSWVIENEKELFISDIHKDYDKYVDQIRYLKPDTVETDSEPRSVMYKPIKLNDEMIGLFTIQSYKVDAFGASEYEVFRIVSTYVSAALRSVYFLQKDEEDDEEWETIEA